MYRASDRAFAAALGVDERLFFLIVSADFTASTSPRLRPPPISYGVRRRLRLDGRCFGSRAASR